MDTPKDICNKYCKQRLQHIVDDKPCPFHLTKVETEMEGDDLKIHTVCEGTIEHPFNTIIDRISKVTKKGIEIIKHEKMPTYENKKDLYEETYTNSITFAGDRTNDKI